MGTPLDPKGRAFAAIQSGQSFYGVVDILGKPYMFTINSCTVGIGTCLSEGRPTLYPRKEYYAEFPK